MYWLIHCAQRTVQELCMTTVIAKTKSCVLPTISNNTCSKSFSHNEHMLIILREHLYWGIMHMWDFKDIPIEQASIDDTLLLWLQVQLFGQHRHDGRDLFLAVHVLTTCVWLEIVGDQAIDFGEQCQDVVLLDIGLEDFTQCLDEPGPLVWVAPREITWNM